MKVVVLQADGLGDEAVADLGGKTPLEVARTPHLDAMASKGILGLARTIPLGMVPGCETGGLAVLGYDPEAHPAGCAAISAVGAGLTLGPADVAFRLSLVSTALSEAGTEIVRDAQGGGLDALERRRLLAGLADALGGEGVEVHAGIGARHLLVWRGVGALQLRTLPPDLVVGKPLAAGLPQGPDAGRVRDLMHRAAEVLATHPVCETRRQVGEPAPTTMWLWGCGPVPALRPLASRWPIRALLLSREDLARGLGQLAGLDVRAVPSPSDDTDDLDGMLAAIDDALAEHDLVVAQLGACDDAGHRGDAMGKVASIEQLDERLVGPLLERLAARGDEWRVLVVSDHATPCGARAHSAEPVPFLVYVAADHGKARGQKRGFDERAARELGIFIPDGHTLLERLLRP